MCEWIQVYGEQIERLETMLCVFAAKSKCNCSQRLPLSLRFPAHLCSYKFDLGPKTAGSLLEHWEEESGGSLSNGLQNNEWKRARGEALCLHTCALEGFAGHGFIKSRASSAAEGESQWCGPDRVKATGGKYSERQASYNVCLLNYVWVGFFLFFFSVGLRPA